MLIIHGTKVRRTLRGTVTAFCPICRLPSQLSVAMVLKQSHLYFVPVGSGTPIADEATCVRCGSVFGASPNAIRTDAFPATDLESAINLLPPEEIERMNQRLEIEDRVASGQLSAAERAILIAEPFAVLDYEFRNRLRGGARESLIAVALVLWIIATMAAFFCWTGSANTGPAHRLPPSQLAPTGAIPLTIAAVVLLVIVVYLIVTQKRHVATKSVVDRIVAALFPLKPSAEEVRAAVRSIPRANAGLARAVTVDEIMQRLG